MLPGRRQGL
jgi:hypothetical protein